MTAIWLMFFLQCKHLIIDWIWQPKFEWSNKGTYGHTGGVLHAAKNASGTALCFFLVMGYFQRALMLDEILFIFAIDYIAHYHIDWAKMNINRIMQWGPTTHNQFWWLTGFDQYFHQITYIALIYWVLAV